MNKRILLPAFGLMLAALLFAGTAVWYTLVKFPPHQSGKLVWNNTEKVNKIELLTPQETVTLLLENDTWVVKEADYYPADSALTNQLLSDLRNAAYFHQQPLTAQALAETNLRDPELKATDSGKLLTVFQNNQLLGRLIIGKPAANKDYHFARHPGAENLWLISGTWQLPSEVYSWILQPILEYPADLIEKVSLESDGSSVSAARQSQSMPFISQRKPVLNLNGLLERFSFFIAEAVLSAQNFDEQLFPTRRRIELTTFSGLITTIELYSNQTEYWVKISLSAAPLTTSGVNTYIRDNSFLYDGWFFKIPAVNGRILAHYKFN